MTDIAEASRLAVVVGLVREGCVRWHQLSEQERADTARLARELGDYVAARPDSAEAVCLETLLEAELCLVGHGL